MKFRYYRYFWLAFAQLMRLALETGQQQELDDGEHRGALISQSRVGLLGELKAFTQRLKKQHQETFRLALAVFGAPPTAGSSAQPAKSFTKPARPGSHRRCLRPTPRARIF